MMTIRMIAEGIGWAWMVGTGVGCIAAIFVAMLKSEKRYTQSVKLPFLIVLALCSGCATAKSHEAKEYGKCMDRVKYTTGISDAERRDLQLVCGK